MNAEQCDRLVAYHLRSSQMLHYGGVKSQDQLKRIEIERFPYALIAHSHKRSVVNRGHWFCVFVASRRESYCYDGYGLEAYGEMAQFLRKHAQRTFYNRNLHQPATARSCGLFAIYVLIKLLRGQKFEKIMRNFGENPETNNERILSYFRPSLKSLKILL